MPSDSSIKPSSTALAEIRPADVIVVGAGPAGLAACLAFRRAGFEAICVGPIAFTDRRTTALLHGSVQFLDRLGLWDALRLDAAPLTSLRLIDRTGRLFRAPDMVFNAGEIGSEAFGHNIANMALTNGLFAAIDTAFIETKGVTALRVEKDLAHLRLSEGPELRAKLIVGADGRNSFCRQAAAIESKSWRYEQTAIVCNFSHSRPHENACTELHYANGPFTVVPLPGNWSSLVWVEQPQIASRLAGLADRAFADAINTRLEGTLGKIGEVTPRGAFPLSGLIAAKLTAPRLALVGEAAHVMPPIGAQGLNLGFRDVADLVQCVRNADDDPGSSTVLAKYEAARRADVVLRTVAADLLNRTLISSLMPMHMIRGAGLAVLEAAPLLRRAAMRQGMAVRD